MVDHPDTRPCARGRRRARPRWLAAGVASCVALSYACGSDPSAGTSGPTADRPAAASAPEGPATTDPSLPSDPLVGLFAVDGTDGRGTYQGLAEITKDGASYHFVRTVHWTGGATVDGGRELHWVFEGSLTGAPSSAHLTASLARADFVAHRGGVTRTAADGPVEVSGTFAAGASGDLVGGFTGANIATSETWSARRAGGGSPLYAGERAIKPTHDAPSASQKASLDQLFAGYRALPVVAPYAARPEFLAAIHGAVVDKTDYAFYQDNPDAVRVAQKVVDDVSIGETLRRANAYRFTLAKKAELFQQDMETKWIAPTVGMVPYGRVDGQASPFPSVDSALWTGTYVAAEAYRYAATGDAAALPQLVASLDALLRLQEITGDWSHFARSLRPSTGSAGGGWHAGTGAFAGVDWLEGGNNDMVKGLFYGYTLGYETLCEGALAGSYASICQRILTNAKHLADDVKVADSDTSQANLTNKLPSSWLYAAIATNALSQVQYRAQAEGFWSAGKAILAATPVYFDQGIVDWSGTHLTFVGDLIDILLAQRLDLGGDAVAVLRAHVDASFKNLSRARFATWDMLEAAFGSAGGSGSPAADDARWRLREVSWPKRTDDVDRRIGPEFCMSPYPAVPWKNDFMSYPDPDRTEGLYVYPLFETDAGDCLWTAGASYQSRAGLETPGADYLHLYWFGRRFGLISATD